MAAANSPAATGPCPSCNQRRVLWPWKPDHDMHWDEQARLNCRWCQVVDTGVELLLCLDCHQAETLREQEAPLDGADATILRLVAAQSGSEPAATPALEERRAS